MQIEAHVKNNTIVLDKPINLPEGTKVIINILEKNTMISSGLCGIWQDKRSSEEIISEVVSSRSSGRELKL